MPTSETDTKPAKAFPFYHQKDEEVVNSTMTDAEIAQTSEDWIDAKYQIDYRRNSGWDQQAKRGMLIYNVTQTASQMTKYQGSSSVTHELKLIEVSTK